ncbi:MAG: UbiA family prenyltransferase [Candidatus Marinimicrobia bacterium]|nr:UbiA family prenyltransferase [Candidatus Neomarinimicrobiota bacterium]
MIKKFLKNHPVHKKLVPYLDVVFLLRPTLFFSVWVMVVMGMASAQMYYFDHPLWISNFSWTTIFVFTGITFVCSSTFILNQISDEKSDTINQKLFLVGNFITIEKSQSISKILWISGLLILIVVNWFSAILVGIIYLIWGIVYNQQPFNWKKKPLLGWFANTIVGVLLFTEGWSLVLQNNPSAPTIPLDISMLNLILPYVLCFSSVSLLTTLPDMKGDSTSGDKTFPIVFGKTLTLLISLTFVIIAFTIALENNDPLASTATIVSIPFFIFAFIRRMDKDILRAIRYPIFILNFFVLSVYPLLFIPLAVTYYVSKYYYWHRFNLHYPTFLVEHD